ncbi:MAG TPA: hypothetical protein VK157_09080, partial [Phycisphaerales bacterium]|nr:hypothetical protein [Phycisphaerales bacterium]
PAPAPVPGGEPNERLASRLSAALGPDGSVIAAYSTSTGSIVVLMGQVDNLQLVFRSRQTITSPRQTAQPGLSIDTVVVWFDADGSGYVRANSLTPLPAGQLSPHCIIRVKPGDTPRIAYIASEPVRRRSGELVPTFLTSSINRTFRTPASGKLVWVVPLSNLNPAVCTLTVDGDPAVMLEGSTAVGDPPIVLGSSLLPPIAPSETPPPLVSNQRGDIAAIVLLQSSSGTAVVASPAYRFTCGDPDFNNDGVYPTDQDMIDFFNVYAGAPCPTLRCDNLDFNRNGSSPEDQDVIDFLTVLAGGSCGS